MVEISTSEQLAEAFNQLLVDIYQIAQSQPPQEFRPSVLNRFSELVPLDTAFWMIRSEVDTPYAQDESYTHNLPHGVLDQYIEYSSVYEQSLLLNQVLVEKMGTTIDVKDIIPQAEWEQSDIYLLLCKEYDIEHSIMTMFPSEHNQMITNVSLNRRAKNPPFSELERRITQAFIPHMAEAHRVNIIANMQNQGLLGYCRGMVDKHGMIIESGEHFAPTLKKAGLLSGQQVDIEALQGTTENETPYRWEVRIESGLYYVELYRKPLGELLSQKKLKMAECIAQGQSNKSISKQLHLSVETINDYVKELYKILGVNSRYEAIGCLLNMGVTKS